MQLTHTVPTCNLCATWSAHVISFVNTPAARLYNVSFAWHNMSSLSLNLMMKQTGPKISSLTIDVSHNALHYLQSAIVKYPKREKCERRIGSWILEDLGMNRSQMGLQV